MTETKFIAHGGYSAKYPENTLESYLEAAKHKPFAIEMDVVLSEDGIPVCYHPHGLSSKRGTYTKEEVQSQLGQGVYPKLAEVLGLIDPHIRVVIDLKQPNHDTFEKVLQLATDFSRIIIGVRSMEDYHAIKGLNPQVETLALFSNPDDYIPYHEAGGKYFRLWEKDVSDKLVHDIQALGLEVWVTPGHKATETQPRTAGEVDETKLDWLLSLGVGGILVNDIHQAVAQQ